MLRSDLQYLWCPVCQSDLSLMVVTSTKDLVDSGYLVCASCEERYPIINGIVNLLPPVIRDELLTLKEHELIWEMLAISVGNQHQRVRKEQSKAVKSAVNWSKQYCDYFPITKAQLDADEGYWSENAFYSYAGIDKGQLKDKIVAVYCGGTGREAYHLGNVNTKKVIVLDIGSYINLLPQLLPGNTEKYMLIRCDVSYSPIRKKSVDIAICDHALQHISDHNQIYRDISNVIVDKGITSVCVYSFENNFLMVKIGEPLKRLLRFVPLATLYYLSFLPALLLYISTLVILWLSLIISSKRIACIPLSEILLLWYKNGFKQFWRACFDLLQAPISHHFKKEEMIQLVEKNEQKILKLQNTFATMWTLVATRK